MLARLERDIAAGPTLSSVAAGVNVSASRFRHLFKDEVGMCFASYVKALRMKRAKELLETTFLSIKEIMVRIGVSDESHFVRDFKRAYGLPPMKYRAAWWA